SEQEALIRRFHPGSETMAAVVAPVGCVLVFLGAEVLALRTRKLGLAEGMAPVMACLSAGALLTSFMTVPGALLLARGELRSPLKASIALLMLQIPLTIYAASRFGLTGAAV